MLGVSQRIAADRVATRRRKLMVNATHGVELSRFSIIIISNVSARTRCTKGGLKWKWGTLDVGLSDCAARHGCFYSYVKEMFNGRKIYVPTFFVNAVNSRRGIFRFGEKCFLR